MSHLRMISLVALLVLVGCQRAAPEPAADTRYGEFHPVTVPLLPAPPQPEPLPVAPMPHEPAERDLTNEDLGFGPPPPDLVDRLAETLIPGPIDPKNPPAPPLNLADLPAANPQPPVVPPGFGPDDPAKPPPGTFSGRSGATRTKFIKHFGGTDDTEKAVALGLEWLAKQQKKDGSWVFDAGTFKNETAAATGFALLAFLGAGETHTPAKDRKHQKTVKAGLEWLKQAVPMNGANAGRISTQMYTQGIGTLALVEAYAMTKDATLKPTAQSAVNYIQRAQGENGSWGYASGNNGDTSITGWQVQALFAAKQAGLLVDDKVFKKAIKFLDTVAAGATQDKYGYTNNAVAMPGTALTASGLWMRVCIDGWEPETAGLKDGAAGLLKRPPAKNRLDVYYLHYATLVMRTAGGDAWQTWNEGPKAADGTRKDGLRDILVGAQITKAGANHGSWDPDAGFIGQSCGRLGTTALCVINLEAYYRYGEPEKKGDKKGADPKK